MTTETVVAGRYRIGPCLGSGGMGRVWLARDEVLRRDVAIKEIALPFGLADDERDEMRARTLREARAAARLSHPNVVRIYDVQAGEERPWIVMEYAPSRSLLQVIKENGPLPPQQVAGIGLAVLAALDAAYRVGVVHRDVKPSNVLIADDGRVLLTDFGSAMVDEGEGALTQTGVILGSPRYIAPERAATGVSTLESDLWSLGATLYEAVEGRGPYTRETTLAMLVALAREKPDPLQLAGPLRPVINGLLQRNPKARMRPAEVEERLRRIADVQSAVRLHRVPAPREGEPVPSPPALAAAGPADPDDDAGRSGWFAAAAVPDGPAGPPPPGAVPAVPAAVPPPPGRDVRRRALVAAGLTIVAAMLAGSAAYVLTDRSERSPAGGPVAAGAGAAAGTSSAAGERTPTAGPATVLPATYRWYDSKSGFHVAWPAKWVKIQESRTSVTLCAPGGPPVLSVREWGRSDPDLWVALRREETAAGLRDYRRVGMVVSPQQDSAEWEYTFTDPKMGKLHALERAVVQSGRAYLLQWRTPAKDWAKHRSKLVVVVNTFRAAAPAAATPGTSTPAGFVAYRNAGGFRLAAPAKWVKLDESPTSVVFCAPGGPPVVNVRAWAPSNVDLVTALRREEELANLPRYRLVSMDKVPGQQGAVWEYTFTDPKMGRLRGLERAIMTPQGAYLVQWRTPAAQWKANLPKLGVVMSSFTTARTTG